MDARFPAPDPFPWSFGEPNPVLAIGKSAFGEGGDEFRTRGYGDQPAQVPQTAFKPACLLIQPSGIQRASVMEEQRSFIRLKKRLPIPNVIGQTAVAIYSSGRRGNVPDARDLQGDRSGSDQHVDDVLLGQRHRGPVGQTSYGTVSALESLEGDASPEEALESWRNEVGRHSRREAREGQGNVGIPQKGPELSRVEAQLVLRM